MIVYLPPEYNADKNRRYSVFYMHDGQNLFDGARLLKHALIEKGWQEGKDFRYLEAADAEHNEKAWAARTAAILEFLFPK